VAAFTKGAAALPSEVVMTSLPTKKPAVLSYLENASMTAAKASYWPWFHCGASCKASRQNGFLDRRKGSTTNLGNLCVEGVHVDEQVDSSSFKSRHASIVIAARVNVIDADGISAKLLHECSIKLALILI